LIRKPTNCKLIVVGGFLEKALRSLWGIGTDTLQLVDFPNKHFAVGGISGG